MPCSNRQLATLLLMLAPILAPALACSDSAPELGSTESTESAQSTEPIGVAASTDAAETATDSTASSPTAASPTAEARLVEAACGQCQFGLQGDGCDLAVRIDGVALFVSGTSIDEHGDAHADDGFCNAIRQAEVIGEVDGDRFAVSAFALVADEGH